MSKCLFPVAWTSLVMFLIATPTGLHGQASTQATAVPTCDEMCFPTYVGGEQDGNACLVGETTTGQTNCTATTSDCTTTACSGPGGCPPPYYMCAMLDTDGTLRWQLGDDGTVQLACTFPPRERMEALAERRMLALVAGSQFLARVRL